MKLTTASSSSSQVKEEGLQRVPATPRWERLVGVVQLLSTARDLATIMEIVRHEARELTDADGATFVLAEGDLCFYADEDAIEPLWKGKRFPMSACVSGWVMKNRKPAVIPDIYADSRVPADAYRPTFVRSMAMVPIRTGNPLGAIGNYWATPTTPTAEQVAVLQALADTTSVAIENVNLYKELEQRVKDRTRDLEAANRELEAFSYSISHDLRAPLRAISGFTRMLKTEHGAQLNAEATGLLDRVESAGERMSVLIESLLGLSRLTRKPLRCARIDLSLMAAEVIASLRNVANREVTVVIAPAMEAEGDGELVRIVLDNLLSNAWKYSSKTPKARIDIGKIVRADEPTVFYVRDNGAGFDLANAQHLFAPFQRFHALTDFPGTGIGLATVQRIVQRHGGRIWAESEVGKGATFFFTLTK